MTLKKCACDKSRQSQNKSTCCWQTDDILIDVYNAYLKLAACLIKQKEIVKEKDEDEDEEEEEKNGKFQV